MTIELTSEPLLDWKSPAVQALLSQTIGNPTAERLAATRNGYISSPQREMRGFFADGHLVGLLGTGHLPGQILEIRHIAVVEELHGRGYGRQIIEELARQYPGHSLLATTDVDALGFYRRCGFTTRSLGNNAYGRERFECRREA